MEKVIKDGKVAIVYSPGYGAGWSTWNDTEFNKTLVFHPKIVNMVLEGKTNQINQDWLVNNFGEEFEDVYCSKSLNLAVEWLEEGTVFRIEEYDGFESILIISDKTTFIA
jgi:hypothetical protein